MFDIGAFTSVVGSHGGLSSPSKFSVRIYPQATDLDTRDMEFFCESASVPGIQIASAPVRRLGYGAISDAPLTATVEPVQLSFYVDNDNYVTGFFTKWAQRVVNFDYQPGGSSDFTSGSYPFQVSYPSDYVAQVEITTYSQEAQTLQTVTLNEAWPRVVGSLTVGWSMFNETLKLPVQLSYTSWTSTLMTQAGPPPPTISR